MITLFNSREKKIFSIQLNDDLMSYFTICIYQAVYLGRLFEMKRNMRTMCLVTLINRWTMDHDIIAHLLRSVPGITHFYLALGSFRSVIWYKQFPQLRKNHLPTIVTFIKPVKQYIRKKSKLEEFHAFDEHVKFVLIFSSI